MRVKRPYLTFRRIMINSGNATVSSALICTSQRTQLVSIIINYGLKSYKSVVRYVQQVSHILQTTKALRIEQRYSSTISRNSALHMGGGGVSPTPPAAFTHGKDPVPTVKEAELAPGQDTCGNSRPHRDSIPGSSSPQPVTIPTELPDPQVVMSRCLICARF